MQLPVGSPADGPPRWQRDPTVDVYVSGSADEPNILVPGRSVAHVPRAALGALESILQTDAPFTAADTVSELREEEVTELTDQLVRLGVLRRV